MEKGKPMHKATIISTSPLLGEHVQTVEHEDVALLYATIAGTVEGITAAGSVVTRLTFDRESA